MSTKTKDSPHARLRRLREAANLSVADLATIADVSRQHIYDLEAGRKSLGNLSLDTAKLIAGAIGVDVASLTE